MKVVIVCASDTYFERVRLLKEYYQKKGNEVLVISSSFSHRYKTTITESMADILIPCREYKKNLSLNRLKNHSEFSRRTSKKLEEIQPDLIYCLIPCNSLAKQMAKYKEKYHCQLIFDVIDLWPETMPIHKFKNQFPFTLWKNLRDDYLDVADKVYVECNLYKEVLKKENYTTLYFAKKEKPLYTDVTLDMNTMSIVYLGSINHIIDMEFIKEFLLECQKYKKVKFHIIGSGESKEELVQIVLESGIQVIDHGKIFDQKEKQAIFDQCHYAFNVMKESVVVGLTMKSVDYMCGGIPLINTIQGDTKFLCDTRNIGFNVTKDTMKDVAKIVCSTSLEENRIQRNNIRDVYCQYFSNEAFNRVLEGEVNE